MSTVARGMPVAARTGFAASRPGAGSKEGHDLSLDANHFRDGTLRLVSNCDRLPVLDDRWNDQKARRLETVRAFTHPGAKVLEGEVFRDMPGTLPWFPKGGVWWTTTPFLFCFPNEEENAMTRTLGLLTAAVLMLGVSAEAARPSSAAEAGSKILKLTVNYTGPGEVDRDHGIHIFVFDNPAFVEGTTPVMPVAMRSVYKNGETISIELFSDTVYLVAVYNEKGNYDPPMAPPPSGTPTALYRPGDPEMPTPIHLKNGETEVTFTFDDQYRMP